MAEIIQMGNQVCLDEQGTSLIDPEDISYNIARILMTKLGMLEAGFDGADFVKAANEYVQWDFDDGEGTFGELVYPLYAQHHPTDIDWNNFLTKYGTTE